MEGGPARGAVGSGPEKSGGGDAGGLHSLTRADVEAHIGLGKGMQDEEGSGYIVVCNVHWDV